MPTDDVNRVTSPWWERYGAMVLSVLLSWLARAALTPVLGPQRLPFVLFYPAVAISAWYGGLGAGLGASLLSAIIADWIFLGWNHHFNSDSLFDVLATGGYLFSCIFIVGAMEMMHRAHRRLLTEIAERHAAQTALAEETNLLSTTLRSIGDAVIATDAKGRVNFLNREAERLTGWEEKEALGQPLSNVFHIIHEETRQPVENPAEKALRDGTVTGLTNHTLLIAKGGTEIPIDDSAAPIRRSDGTISGVVLVFRDFTEKQVARRSMAWLAAIVEFSGDAIITKNLKGVVQSWNAGAERLFGYKPEEIIGKPVTVLFPPERLKEEDAILERIRAGLPVERLETIRVAKDGRHIPVAVSISPIKDSDGLIIGASKIIQDISKLATAREELVQEKELLATTLASIGDAVLITDPEGRVKFLNRQAEQLTAWTTAEAAGRSLSEVFHIINEQTRKRVEDPVAEVVRSGGVVGLANHTLLIGKDGRETPIDDSAAPIRREGGPLYGIVLVFRDFSERKRQERQQLKLYSLVQAVNQARALPEIYEAALEAITQCLAADRSSILLIDPDGVMRFRAWRALSEKYRAAVEGHSPWSADAIAPEPICIEDSSQALAEFREVFRQEGIGALAFVPINYHGKLLGKFMVYYNEVHHFKPEELRLATTVASQVGVAIRRRRNQEELEILVRNRTAKLREMIAELQHVSYAITHDMRAPLRAMSTFAGIIYEGLASGQSATPELLDFCRRIIASATRLDQLIKDALNYTKAVLQELPLHPVDLSHLVPSLIESYPNLQSDKADISIKDPLPVVLGEESLLTQCFSNLLGNAVKFVTPGVRPKVTLRVESTHRTAKIFVEDNGIGIPADSLHRLFGMFERLTTGYEGTGIGLAIVRKVVERMGGKVGVESQPGRGSSFWVELQTVPAKVKLNPASPP